MEIDLLFINVNCLRFTSHWVFRSSGREASCMQVTRCTILHFGNLAGVVLQHVSHRVSRYLHYAVLSDVCYEVRRRWVDFLISIRRKFLKLLFYNMLEAGINQKNSVRVFYCDHYKNSKVFKMFYFLMGE